MYTVMTRDNLINERNEALSKRQGLYFVQPYKIMRRYLLCQDLL